MSTIIMLTNEIGMEIIMLSLNKEPSGSAGVLKAENVRILIEDYGRAATWIKYSLYWGKL